jgi:16S rRNA (cytosine1402-N4)-methyltransferase
VLLDAGVSSSQLDDTQRGFSFQREGPLDMRMSPSSGPPASNLLNTLPERELARLIWRYGEERLAKCLARHIVRARSRGGLRTVTDLARLIETAAPRWAIKTKARVFQALRIAVNDELDNLRCFLTHMPSLLPSKSRLVVISYHSLEDRLVKQAFRLWATPCTCPPHAPQCTCDGRPRARLLTKRVMRPDAAEQAANPRSRSAKLRAVEWLVDPE